VEVRKAVIVMKRRRWLCEKRIELALTVS